MPTRCPTDNTLDVEQSDFWQTLTHGGKLEAHEIGWIISGGCTVVTCLVALIHFTMHLRNYRKPREQKQILRIILLPPIFGIISFFSYRFFREYYYYEFVQIIYEAITIAAFMLLIIEYVASTASGNNAENAIARKDKQRLPIPFCCWRFRPTKAYFMYTVKWSVLQYAIVRPAISIASIITNAFGLYCETEGYSFHYAFGYLEAVDFISITIALYGLFVFYTLTKEELNGRRPLAKFLAIKLIVFFTFYQAFVFSILEKTDKIKETKYWSSTNIVNGLSALCLTVEMVFFAFFMMWAYPASEYKMEKPERLSVWRGLWDCINWSDFVLEIYYSLRFFVHYMLGKPGTSGVPDAAAKLQYGGYNTSNETGLPTSQTHSQSALVGQRGPKDFGQAFGLYDQPRGWAYENSNQPSKSATGSVTDEQYQMGPVMTARRSGEEGGHTALAGAFRSGRQQQQQPQGYARSTPMETDGPR